MMADTVHSSTQKILGKMIIIHVQINLLQKEILFYTDRPKRKASLKYSSSNLWFYGN